MSKKTFVIDTNVILNDAECIFKFDDNNVVVPFAVVEEVDTFKKDQSELGRNARAFSRYVDKLREKGKLTEGVDVNIWGGRLYVVLFDQTVANCLPYQDMSLADNRILATTRYVETYMKIQTEQQGVTLVTLDTNLRIKGDALGMKAEDYKNSKVTNDELYLGIVHINVTPIIIERVYKQKKLALADIFSIEDEPYPNECFVLHSDGNDKQRALVRYDGVLKSFNLLPQDMKTVDINPKNTEQQFALDLLKDVNLSLVTMQGLAGSGKTLVALAAGIDAVLNNQQYSKIMLFKPIIAMDNSHELGFLPGSIQEKLSPWMASYSDNLEFIMQGYLKDKISGDTKPKGMSNKEWELLKEKQQGKTNPIQELMDLGLLEMGSLEHLRGRSLSNSYIILDECQNISVSAIKTVLTRAGEGTKIVLLADINQIDSPYLDSRSNGFTKVVESFKDQQLSGHVTMRKSERSKLAEVAATIL